MRVLCRCCLIWLASVVIVGWCSRDLLFGLRFARCYYFLLAAVVLRLLLLLRFMCWCVPLLWFVVVVCCLLTLFVDKCVSCAF